MAGLKVRLDDGSEVGPLDLRMVQTWYQQGLIGPDGMVQKPGNPRWMRLSEAADLQEWGPAPISRPAGAAARGGAAAEPGCCRGSRGGPLEALCRRGAPLRSGRRRRALRVLARPRAARAGRRALAADRAGPRRPRPWPRARVELGPAGRARRGPPVAAAAAFPLAGVFVAKGMRGEALLDPGLRAGCSPRGFAAFLAPRLSRLKSAASLLLILLAGAGLVRYVPAEASAAQAVAPWTAPERRVANEEMGLALALPQGWAVLKPGNSLVTRSARGQGAPLRSRGYPDTPSCSSSRRRPTCCSWSITSTA